jgi:hypothetical protein
MRDEVIEALRGAGELTLTQIKVTGNRRMLVNLMTKMCLEGHLHRRMVSGPKGDMWAYIAVDTSGPYLRGEPDYCYHLRTLGKDLTEGESDACVLV